MNRQIKAFTLMELAVVMLLTSLVVGIVYYAYQVINRQFHAYNQRQEQLSNLQKFVHLLEKDSFKHQYLKGDANTLIFSSDNQQVYYHRNDTVIVREQDFQTDTFKLIIGDLYIKYFSDSLISELQMTIFNLKDTLRYQHEMQYDAAALVNQQLINNEWNTSQSDKK